MHIADAITVAAIFAAPMWWMLDGVRWIFKKNPEE